jgi:hypothetical protein
VPASGGELQKLGPNSSFVLGTTSSILAISDCAVSFDLKIPMRPKGQERDRRRRDVLQYQRADTAFGETDAASERTAAIRWSQQDARMQIHISFAEEISNVRNAEADP